jgi:uncharacterized protein
VAAKERRRRQAATGGRHLERHTQAPETFDLTIEEDETLYVISGHLQIDVIGGESFDLVDGSMASFNKGAKTRWTVVEPTVEFFVYS